jgi:2-polyprenyl-3-methyl-5-hydroxy-6-metoxy-1,4-benzoquinol methylase
LSSFALASIGVNVTAIDISEKLIVDLRRVQAELGGAYAAHLQLCVWDIFRLREIGKTYDAVCSDGTYEHFLDISDRRKILENVRAILKPGGLFIVAVPNLHNPFFRLVVDRRMPAMQYFRAADLARELCEGGMTVVETGFSFVNPGFAQWVKAPWMIAAIRAADAVFRFLPRPLKKIFAAHVYCVASLPLQ